MKLFAIFLTLIIYISQPIQAVAKLPFLENDSQLNNSFGWNLLPNGLLFAGYDLNANGKADFYTIRIVTRSFFSKNSVERETENWPNNLTLFVNHDSVAGVNFFHITSKQALLYALDLNEDETWDLIYKDPLEDGLNGNEKFYDDPGKLLDSTNRTIWLKHVLSRLCTCQKKSCPLQQTARC